MSDLSPCRPDLPDRPTRLRSSPDDEESSCELAEHALDTLAKVCSHDTEGFLNKERFHVLMQPLVDQVRDRRRRWRRRRRRRDVTGPVGGHWREAVLLLLLGGVMGERGEGGDTDGYVLCAGEGAA